MLEMHGINFRLSPRHKGLAFDLVEPIVMVKHRDVGKPPFVTAMPS